jgi:DNA-binding NarL/FixJ family response regulator
LLILDDERFDRHRLQRLCSGLPEPMQVTTADCLAKLADALEGDSFDLIFVDYNLPDGSGVDALEMIRLCPRNCTAATVMVTGLERREMEKSAQDNGCAGFLAKDDLDPDIFASTVAHALRAKAPPQVGQAQYDAAEVAQLLAQNNSAFARDMKPHVSRMLRQLRLNRSQQAVATDGQDHGRQALENSCVALWDYLVSVERQDPVLPAPSKKVAVPPAAEGRRKGKPPSPFSRMN